MADPSGGWRALTDAAPSFSPQLPMSYLHTYGPRADPATSLTWALLVLSCSVIVIITLLVVAGVLARRDGRPIFAAIGAPLTIRGDGLQWISIGLALTVVALVASVVWTVAALAEVNSPAGKPALTVEITGHQWWWEVRYDGDDSARAFTTANEIHIPVGEPVRVKLAAADVIHSFWVPALTGKTDAIPGRINVAWLQADRPGVYRGQCTEYCGEEHAHMALYVVADPPARFAAWRQAQLQPASEPLAPAAIQGAAVFQNRCSACHTVRGTPAGGVVGPDLTHLMSRSTIAAGTLPNNIASLSGWILNPQALKPGAKMPPTGLSGPELAQVRAYLETLR